jgi:hypothetical protein
MQVPKGGGGLLTQPAGEKLGLRAGLILIKPT